MSKKQHQFCNRLFNALSQYVCKWMNEWTIQWMNEWMTSCGMKCAPMKKNEISKTFFMFYPLQTYSLVCIIKLILFRLKTTSSKHPTTTQWEQDKNSIGILAFIFFLNLDFLLPLKSFFVWNWKNFQLNITSMYFDAIFNLFFRCD